MDRKFLTFSMIKPDATERNIIGKIITDLEDAGLRIVAQRRLVLTMQQAQLFYQEHAQRGFFGDLCAYITSGPVVAQVLSGGDDVVQKNRTIMGATDPAAADEGTLRRKYGISKEKNSVHGSDSAASAERELAFFFSGMDICI